VSAGVCGIRSAFANWKKSGGAEPQRGSRHHLALGSAVRPGIEPLVPPGTAANEPLVESRRDLLPCRRQLDVFIGWLGERNVFWRKRLAAAASRFALRKKSIGAPANRRAGSPSGQTPGPSESGVPSLSLGVANASGNRSDEHDTQGTSPMAAEEQHRWAGCVHRTPLFG
jgi:hypothetical protein